MIWLKKLTTILKATWVRYAALAVLGLALIVVLIQVFFRRKPERPIKPVVLDTLNKASADYEATITEAVVELAAAKGKDEIVQAQLRTINDMPTPSVRRRRLIALYKSL